MHETFWTLLRDPAHWEFELFLMVVFDGLIVGLLWPFVRVHWKHHLARDYADGIQTRDPWTAQAPLETPEGVCAGCSPCSVCVNGVIVSLDTGVEMCRECGDIRCTPQEGGQ